MQGPGAVLNVITVPPGAGLGQRIVIDGLRGAVFEYDNGNNLVGSWASVAGTDPYGNSYPQGFSITGSGFFSGTITAGSISNTPIGGSVITSSDFQGGTMEDTNIVFDSNGGRLLVYTAIPTTVTFTTAGSNTWPAPAGVTSVKVQLTGGGGSGQGQGGIPLPNLPGHGGGGGEFASELSVAVTPGNNYAYTVGAGGSGGFDGTASTFTGDAITVTANGGKFGDTGGAGGTGSTNSIHFNGGSGGSGILNNGGGGGGSSAGTASNGNNGHNASGTSGGAGGTAPAGGGNGGAGGARDIAGSNGVAPGGGGGGGGRAHTGGAGAAGKVILTYQTGLTLIASVAATAGSDGLGNNYPRGFAMRIGQVDTSTSDLTNRTVTSASSTQLGSTFTIPASDAVVGTIYEYEAWGSGTWGSTQQQANFIPMLNGVSTGSQGMANTTLPASTAFNWHCRVHWYLTATGVSGNLDAHLEMAISANTAAAQAGAVAMRTVTVNTFNTTITQTIGLNFNWAATTGAPTITCHGTKLTRKGPF